MFGSELNIRRLVLASGSPRRRQLLSLLGIPFVIKAAGVDEQPLPGEAPSELALRVSQTKALSIHDLRADELVLAADTIVALGTDILGKPADQHEAAGMLARLRGRRHLVYTAVAVYYPTMRSMVCEIAETAVQMRNYSDAEIAAYVASGDPMDKAGAYAIQHPVFDPASQVDGCWLNVMGLPLCHVARALAQFGVDVPVGVPGTCQAFSQRTCPVPQGLLR
jgi:MAF protein